MKKIIMLLLFSVFTVLWGVDYGNRESGVLQVNAEWKPNIFMVPFEPLMAGDYFLTAEVELENALPKGQLTAVLVANGRERSVVYLETNPGKNFLSIPVKARTDNTPILLVFEGKASIKAPGRILLHNLKLEKNNSKNLIPAWRLISGYGKLPANSWLFEAREIHGGNPKNIEQVFSYNGKVITVAQDTKAVIASPEIIIPENKPTKVSVKIKGAAKIQLWLHSSLWKKVNNWQDPQAGSREIFTTNEENTYEFTFPASKDNQYYRWRLDIQTAASPIEVGMPILTVADEDEDQKAESKKAELIYENDFSQKINIPATANVVQVKDPVMGNALVLNKDSFLELPMNGTFAPKSGTASFWVKLDKDFVFDPQQTNIWQLGNSTLMGIFVWGRIGLGEFGCQQGIFEQIYKNEWNLITYSWDNNKHRKLYFNGRLFFVVPWASGSESFSTLRLGKRGHIPSISGAVANVKIYENEQTAEEIMADYAKNRPVTPFMLDYSGIAGEESVFRIGFDNRSKENKVDKRNIVICSPNGEAVFKTAIETEVPAETYKINQISFTPSEVGNYRIIMTDPIGDTYTAVLPIIHNEVISERETPAKVEKTLIAEIDCSKEQPKGTYADDGGSCVNTLNGVGFRETLRKEPSSGFTYRIKIKNPGKPHWIEFDYPDDRTRTFFCGISQVLGDYFHCMFLDSCGIITGGNFPLSKTMKTKGFYFMTAANRPEIGVVFGSHYNPNGESGPAVAKIRIYEVTSALPNNHVNPDGRKIMNWNEDPTMFGYTHFNQYQWNAETTNYDYWREKYDVMVEYHRYMGWGMWSSLFYDYGGLSTIGDRRGQESVYSGGIFQPGFLDMLAKTAEREKIPYYLSINHLCGFFKENTPFGIGIELGGANISDTFEQAEKRGENAPELFAADNSLARVRNRALNPIHPLTREALKKNFRICAERYGIYPMFQGIDYQSVEGLHFSDPFYGYGDYTINLYRKETDTKLPDYQGSERFSKRYEFLKANEWEKWLDWRCEKVTELVKELVAELQGKKLIYRVTMEQLIPSDPSKRSLIRDDLIKGKMPDLVRAFREQGIDLKALAKLDNVIVLPDLRPNHTRIFGDKGDERPFNFSDELFSLRNIEGIENFQITQQNNQEMYEGGGFIPTANGTQKASLRVFATTLPNNEYALENIAWAVAKFDPLFINHGWWGNPEMGAHEEFRKFYRAYSEIPQQSFAQVSGVNDPICVRQNDNMIYMVNLSVYPASVGIEGSEIFELTDVVTNETQDLSNIKLNGFELRVFKQDHEVDIKKVTQNVPEELVDIVEHRLKVVPENHETVKRAKLLYEQGRYAAAYYVLQHQQLLPFFDKVDMQVLNRFLPDGKTLELIIKNPSSKIIKGKFSLYDLPQNWQFKQKSITAEIAPGKTQIVKFVLSGGKAEAGKCYTVRLGMKIDNSENFRTIRIQPVLAKYAPQISETNFHLGKKFPKVDLICESAFKELFSQHANFAANYSLGWSEKGLALTIRIEDRDFLPPPSTPVFWQNDSIVVYFGKKETAKDGVKEYAPSDVGYRIAQVQGKEIVQKGEDCVVIDTVKAKIYRENGWTIYELFFPKEELSQLKMKALETCSFSMEAINCDTSTRRAVFTPHAAHPHMNPFVWSDLILIK